jgi:hypothetical protein
MAADISCGGQSMSERVMIECDCGATGEAPIGVVVECECGRTFQAAPPPLEHASCVRRLQRRHRLALVTSLAILVLVCAAPLLVLDESAALLVPAAALALWLSTVRPVLERRHRRALAALPGWSLPGS